jgi:hypothetical protein
MKDKRSESGETMEDILASIRRIIAEGEREAQPERNKPKPLGSSSRPRPEPVTAAARAAQRAEADVLVLTQMLQDDGTVVNLASPAAAVSEPTTGVREASVAPTPLAEGTSAAAEVSAEFDVVMEAAAGDQATIHHPLDQLSEERGKNGSSDGALDSEGTPTEVLQEHASGLDAAAADMAAPIVGPSARGTDAVVSVGSPSDLPLQQSEVGTPSVSLTFPAVGRSTVSESDMKSHTLISEEAMVASTAALTHLAESVSRPKDEAVARSRTVEDLVREAVEPMLKQWLDAHLPRIVERLVRSEIDRIVRRVE